MSLIQLLIDATALGAMLALVAMGIALVFGVMRLVNFAYGELITIGAYTLVLTKGWPILLRVLAAFVVVIASSLLMELVFRPLRRAHARARGDSADPDRAVDAGTLHAGGQALPGARGDLFTVNPSSP